VGVNTKTYGYFHDSRGPNGAKQITSCGIVEGSKRVHYVDCLNILCN